MGSTVCLEGLSDPENPQKPFFVLPSKWLSVLNDTTLPLQIAS